MNLDEPVLPNKPSTYYTQPCASSCPEHLIQFHWLDWETLYVHYFLDNHPWYERVWLAVKYIFGFKSKYGHFGEMVLGKKEVADLVDFLLAFQNEGKE